MEKSHRLMLLFHFESKSKLLTYCFKLSNETTEIFLPMTFS